jgi:hypothetical protein
VARNTEYCYMPRHTSTHTAASEPVNSDCFSLLPEEMLLEIAKRLDNESLCRFACVCKRFYVAKFLLVAPSTDFWES